MINFRRELKHLLNIFLPKQIKVECFVEKGNSIASEETLEVLTMYFPEKLFVGDKIVITVSVVEKK